MILPEILQVPNHRIWVTLKTLTQIFTNKDNKANKWDIAGNVFAEVDLKHFTAHCTSFGGIVDNNYGFNFNFVGYENAEGNTGSNSFTEQSKL